MVRPAERIIKALVIAGAFAQTTEARHKSWVIDQMARALLQDKYDEWVKELMAEDGPKTWDVGVAPLSATSAPENM